MEAILFIGIQAAGKSSFYREKFFDTHLRLNMDSLKTRKREDILLRACLDAKMNFVIDNTNPTREERSRYIQLAREEGFRVVGYAFGTTIEDALTRNAAREGKKRIPVAGVRGTRNKLQWPEHSEGFDELYYVKLEPTGTFTVEEWKDEV